MGPYKIAYLLEILVIKLPEVSNHLSQWNMFKYKLFKFVVSIGSTVFGPYPSLAWAELHKRKNLAYICDPFIWANILTN